MGFTRGQGGIPDLHPYLYFSKVQPFPPKAGEEVG